MSELVACELDFAAAVAAARDGARALPWLAGDAARNTERLAIYRANAAAAVAAALRGAYPVIAQLLGPAGFAILAREHQRAAPSTEGDLNELGAALAGIIAAHEIGDSLPYLADLARLEWAAHLAYGAADAEPLAPDALARLAAAPPAALRLRWAAGTALVASRYPIARIWQIHQPGFDGAFEVDWSCSETALVAREGLRVTVQALGAGEAAFVAASLAGESFATAAERALASDAAVDLGRWLTRLIAAQTLCGFTLHEER